MTAAPGPGERPRWLRRLMGYVRAHPGLAVAAVAAASATAVFEVANPLVVRHVVDQLLGSPGRSIAPWVGVLVVLALLQYATSFGRRFFSARLAFTVQHELRSD